MWMQETKSVLIISTPFAETSIPSVQLALLESCLKRRNIKIKTKHLYLAAARFYGLNNYNLLINSPNDSYTAQMIFSKYVFSEHWDNTKQKFKDFFEQIIAKGVENKNFLSFEEYAQKTDQFYNWVLDNIDWESYDIIGFTLNYGQFLPSLAIAKKIKEVDPSKIIVFGGSTIIDQLGMRILEIFDFVDFIVSGDGEEALYRMATDYDNFKSIPNLIYRNGKDAIWNESNTFIDLNTLPTPDYDSYFVDLSSTSEEVQQYFFLHGRLPLEISRGCWWNRCTFCNLEAYHKKYREKTVEKIIDELKFLSEKYHILTFQLIGNTLPKNDYKILFEKIIELKKDFTFFVEARADKLKSIDYKLLKEAGFTNIQTGIETFSKNYLKKINKGVRLIDNVAALKFCKEYGIKNNYNMIINYPNEETIDFEETVKNISLFKQYLEPPQISYFKVGFKSPIYNNLKEFNIDRLEPTNTDKIMFPENILKKNICFFYNFKRIKDFGKNNWDQLITDWRNEYERNVIEGTKRQTLIDKLILFYTDGGNFLRIYDRRNAESAQIYTLDELERKVFLACIDVISRHELQERFPDIPDYKLGAILDTFEQSRIVFHEDDLYLSLPLRGNTKIIHQLSKQEVVLA